MPRYVMVMVKRDDSKSIRREEVEAEKPDDVWAAFPSSAWAAGYTLVSLFNPDKWSKRGGSAKK